MIQFRENAWTDGKMEGQKDRWKDGRTNRPHFIRPFWLPLAIQKKPYKSVKYKNFKMETLATIIQLIRPNMYMAKLDIKDAYYSIPIYETHQKSLKFEHKSRLF